MTTAPRPNGGALARSPSSANPAVSLVQCLVRMSTGTQVYPSKYESQAVENFFRDGPRPWLLCFILARRHRSRRVLADQGSLELKAEADMIMPQPPPDPPVADVAADAEVFTRYC